MVFIENNLGTEMGDPCKSSVSTTGLESPLSERMLNSFSPAFQKHWAAAPRCAQHGSAPDWEQEGERDEDNIHTA